MMTIRRLIMQIHRRNLFGFTRCLVPHFKPITTGVCGDALELRFRLTHNCSEAFFGRVYGVVEPWDEGVKALFSRSWLSRP
jgi:hypothetical protein